MSDTTTTTEPVQPKTPEELKELKKENARHNMAGSPFPMTPAPDPAHDTEDSPLTDAEALAVGHAVGKRYEPPDPPPSVLEQIEAMKNPQPKSE
jgi:hypothetical protein